jgi:hypothetical protein
MERLKGTTRGIVRVSVGIALIAGMGLSQAASANTLHVCGTCAHTTIQSAVNDAASGDTVSIAAGRYVENITVAGKAVTILGAGSSVSAVVGAGRGPVFTLGSGTPAEANYLITIQGLTISGGHHDGGTGIGGGVQVRAGSYLHLVTSSVVGNYALIGGGGIGVQTSPGAPQTTISGCVIDSNTVKLGKWGGQGGGIIVMGGSSIAIDNSFITRNESTEGGGVLAAPGTAMSVTATTVSKNISHGFGTPVGPTGGGGGGLETSGSVSVDGSVFLDNVADTPEIYGGGIVMSFYSSAVSASISNTIIARNSAPGGGGITAYGGGASKLKLNNVYIVQNNAMGIFYPGVTLVQTNTTVKDNVGGNYCDNISPCTF